MDDKTVVVPMHIIGEVEELCFRRAFELLDEAERTSVGSRLWANDRADALFALGLSLQPRRGPQDKNPPQGIWRPKPIATTDKTPPG